jgi:hypothetical protein
VCEIFRGWRSWDCEILVEKSGKGDWLDTSAKRVTSWLCDHLLSESVTLSGRLLGTGGL